MGMQKFTSGTSIGLLMHYTVFLHVISLDCQNVQWKTQYIVFSRSLNFSSFLYRWTCDSARIPYRLSNHSGLFACWLACKRFPTFFDTSVVAHKFRSSEWDASLGSNKLTLGFGKSDARNQTEGNELLSVRIVISFPGALTTSLLVHTFTVPQFSTLLLLTNPAGGASPGCQSHWREI